MMHPKPVKRPKRTLQERQARARKLQRRSAARSRIPKQYEAKGRLCRMDGPNCTIWASDGHHDTERGMGGRKGQAKRDNDATIVPSCAACHRDTHQRPWVFPGWTSKWSWTKETK